MQICRLDPIAVILCLCLPGGLFWWTSLRLRDHGKHDIRLSNLERHPNAPKRKLLCLCISKLWNLGLSSSHGWSIYTGCAIQTVGGRQSQWFALVCWSKSSGVTIGNGRNRYADATQNNAEEGAPFVPQNITTENDLVTWLQLTFPLFTNSDVAKVLLYYPTGNASVNPNADDYATNGLTGATANNESAVATGQQQRANVSQSSSTRWRLLTMT